MAFVGTATPPIWFPPNKPDMGSDTGGMGQKPWFPQPRPNPFPGPPMPASQAGPPGLSDLLRQYYMHPALRAYAAWRMKPPMPQGGGGPGNSGVIPGGGGASGIPGSGTGAGIPAIPSPTADTGMPGMPGGNGTIGGSSSGMPMFGDYKWGMRRQLPPAQKPMSFMGTKFGRY